MVASKSGCRPQTPCPPQHPLPGAVALWRPRQLSEYERRLRQLCQSFRRKVSDNSSPRGGAGRGWATGDSRPSAVALRARALTHPSPCSDFSPGAAQRPALDWHVSHKESIVFAMQTLDVSTSLKSRRQKHCGEPTAVSFCSAPRSRPAPLPSIWKLWRGPSLL